MEPENRSVQSGSNKWALALSESQVPGLLAGAWNWARLIGEPAGIAGAATVLTFVAILIFFRSLSQKDAGQLTLLFAILQTLLLVGSLGQPSLIVRLYSRKPRGHFNWPRDLRYSAGFSIPLIFAGSLLAQRIYALSTGHTFYIFAGASAFAVMINASSVLSSQQLYIWAIPILRVPNALLIVPAVAFAVEPEIANLETVLTSNLLFIGLTAVLAIYLLSRLVPSGITSLSLRSRLQGLVFLASSSSSLIPEQGLIAIAGIMIAPEALAIYAALALLLRGFEFLADVMSKVLSTELLKREIPNYGNLFIGLVVMILGMGAVAVVATPTVSRWIYAGRYDHGAGLIGWLVLAGMFRLSETLPRGYITGHASDKQLRSVISARILIGLVGAILGVVLISKLGLIGLASSRAGIYLARSLAGYYYFRQIHISASSSISDTGQTATG
jgi:O-antigen/teichoic acid export membrane protein